MSTQDFYNGDLSRHFERIVENFIENPTNLIDSLPRRSGPVDNGAGQKTYYLDAPNIEESYLYATEEERDRDYGKLITLIRQRLYAAKKSKQ